MGSMPTDDTTPTLGLREEKKRRTRAIIEDHATRLVLEHGISNVTVEDICKPAGISKRTFFNYFASKEEAILGVVAGRASNEDKELFLNTHYEHLYPSLVDFVLEHLVLNDFNRELEERRKVIKQREPAFMGWCLTTFMKVQSEQEELVEEYLQRHPALKSTSLSTAVEARLLVSLCSIIIHNSIRAWEESLEQTFASLPKHVRMIQEGLTALIAQDNQS